MIAMWVCVDGGMHAPSSPLRVGHSDSGLDSTQEDK